MPDAESPLLLNLLITTVGLLVLLILFAWSMSRRLARIERSLLKPKPQSDPLPPSTAETSTGGAFEAFLSEDPARHDLPKGEQFTAYRKWRQEKGLNWSNS